MIIHKATMGVIEYIWTGTYTQTMTGLVPKNQHATFENCHIPEEERDQWWEIDGKSSLGIKIRNCYPNCTPVTDEAGNLIDIKMGVTLDTIVEAEEIAKEDMKKKSKKKPKQKNQRINLFPGLEKFIGDINMKLDDTEKDEDF